MDNLVTLYSIKDCADVIKIMDLEMGKLSWIIQMDPVKSQVLRSRELFLAVRRRDAMIEGSD